MKMNRVALVTGASSGIGAAIVRRLAADGLHIAMCARRLDRHETLAEEVRAMGVRCLPLQTDLRQEDQILSTFATIRAEFGGVDVLINNAGLGREAPLLTGETDHWRSMLEVNILALSVCTREAVADMRRRGDDGHVVHLSSMAGHRMPKSPTGAFYAATKHAVRALTEGLRRELWHAGSGIRIAAISPGFVETEFAAVFRDDPDAPAQAYGQYPCMQASEIADLVANVLSQPPHVQIHDILLRPTRQET
jgi:NADP-dependent 3-hydroxy acid dehydrogenase YdfG